MTRKEIRKRRHLKYLGYMKSFVITKTKVKNKMVIFKPKLDNYSWKERFISLFKYTKIKDTPTKATYKGRIVEFSKIQL